VELPWANNQTDGAHIEKTPHSTKESKFESDNVKNERKRKGIVPSEKKSEVGFGATVLNCDG